ncbi:APC family permease [Rhodococcus triatomae]
MTGDTLTGGHPPSTPGGGGHAAGGQVLGGRMSTTSLLLTVLAFSAPIAAVAGYIPFTISFGGQASTLVFIIATAGLLMFAVGYVTMTKDLPKPGSFYAFISAGIGKIPGLGAAFVAVVSYLLMLSGCFVFTGLTVTEFIQSINGPETPWWLWTAIAWIAVSVMCYFHIEVSAKILGVAMLFEIAIVVVFNVAVVFHGGGTEGYSVTPFNPAELGNGSVGVALLFAVMVFLGFEATALFRDEVRDPDRTIPRATYGAVLLVGTLYIVSCYLLTTVYGSDAVQVATDNPKGMFPDAIGNLVAPAFTQLTFLFIITSELAAAISVHNVVSRYVYNLGRDAALPTSLAVVHPRHRSPARASVSVAAVAGLVVLVLGLANSEGEGLDAQMFGLGTVGVLVLMALVSVSVVVWFARRGVPEGASWVKCYLAPTLAAIALVSTNVLAVLHFDLVVGGAPGQNLGLLLVLAASFAIGAGTAVYFRYAKPDVFASLGRADEGA